LKEKVKEEFIASFEKAMIRAGATNYEQGMAQTIRAVTLAYSAMRRIRTQDELRKALDRLEPMSRSEERLALFFIRFLPQIVRILFRNVAKQADRELPSLHGGRPRVASPDKARTILDYIGDLHRKGCTFKVAKQRASMKFGCSHRTIERLWAKRHGIDEHDPTIQDVLVYLANG